MKRLYSHIFCLVWLFGLHPALAQAPDNGTPTTDLKKAALLGSVKEMTQRMYLPKVENEEVVPDKPYGNDAFEIKIMYDSLGYKKEGKIFNESNTLHRSWRFKYGESYRKANWEWFDGQGMPLQHWEYTYDSRGYQQSERLVDVNHKVQAKNLFEHDAKGNRTSWKSVQPDGDLEGESVYKYRFDDKLVEESFFQEDDHMNSTIRYSHDEHGHVVEEKIYGNKMRLIERRTFTYDENGLNIEWRSYNADDEETKFKVLMYDAQGNNTKWALYNGKGELTRTGAFVYEYDDNGNWVKRVSYRDDKPTLIELREFVYF